MDFFFHNQDMGDASLVDLLEWIPTQFCYHVKGLVESACNYTLAVAKAHYPHIDFAAVGDGIP